MTLNVLKNDTTKKRGIKGKQKNATWDHSYLLFLLGFNAFALNQSGRRVVIGPPVAYIKRSHGGDGSVPAF